MTVKKKPARPPVLATNEQVAEWKREIDDMKKMLSGKEIDPGVSGRPDKIQDPKHIEYEIKKRERIIAEHSPHKIAGAKANEAYKRAKELKEKIIALMPTAKEYYQPRPGKTTPTHRGSDFEATVRRQMEFQKPEVQKMVQEYKHIMGSLDPSNPAVRNIETLRKQDRRVR